MGIVPELKKKQHVIIFLGKGIREKYEKVKEAGYKDSDIFKLGLEYALKKEEMDKKVSEVANKLESVAEMLSTSFDTVSSVSKRVADELIRTLGDISTSVKPIKTAGENAQKITDLLNKLEVQNAILTNLIDELKKALSGPLNQFIKEILANYYTKIVNQLKSKNLLTPEIAQVLAETHRNILDIFESREKIKE